MFLEMNVQPFRAICESRKAKRNLRKRSEVTPIEARTESGKSRDVKAQHSPNPSAETQTGQDEARCSSTRKRGETLRPDRSLNNKKQHCLRVCQDPHRTNQSSAALLVFGARCLELLLLLHMTRARRRRQSKQQAKAKAAPRSIN